MEKQELPSKSVDKMPCNRCCRSPRKVKHAAVSLLAEPAPHSGEGECTTGGARKNGPNLSQQQPSVERETLSEQAS